MTKFAAKIIVMGLRAIWANNPPSSKFLIAIAIILISLVVFSIISLLLTVVIYHVGLLEIADMIDNPEDALSLSVIKFIQTVSSIGAFILPGLFLAWTFDQNGFSYLKLTRSASFASVMLVFLTIISALPLINFLGEINSKMTLPSWLSGVETWMRNSEDKAAMLTQKLLDINSPFDLFLTVIMIALLPAIGEELIFRGIIQRVVTEWSRNVHIGIWVSAVLFSALHMQFFGFLPRMLLGAMLGYLFLWSGSLWLSMTAHFINNASAVIFTYMFKHNMMGLNADTVGTESDYQSTLFSVGLTAILLFTIYRIEKRRKPQEETIQIE